MYRWAGRSIVVGIATLAMVVSVTPVAAGADVGSPALTSIDGTTGPADGGNLITLHGSGLGHLSFVNFNNVDPAIGNGFSSSDIYSGSATSAIVRVPAGTAGQSFEVSAYSATGNSDTANGPTYTYNANTRAQVTDVSQQFGPLEGGTAVQLTGTGFTGVTQVEFVDATDSAATYTNAVNVVSDTEIDLTTPAAPKPGNYSIHVSGLGVSDGDDGVLFDFATDGVRPAVTDVSPASGSTFNTVITGTHFTHATEIELDSELSSNDFSFRDFTIDSDTQITVNAGDPLTFDGPYRVLVITDTITPKEEYGKTFNVVGSATAVPPLTAPIPADITPSDGPASGGTSVSITGQFMLGVSSVLFNGVPTQSFVVNDDERVTAVTPPGTGTNDAVTLVGPGGSSDVYTNGPTFTYDAATPQAPQIDTIDTSHGPVSGGTVVHVSGSNFTDVTEVDFGSVAGTNLVINDDSDLTVTTPAHAAGQVGISASNSDGLNTGGSGPEFIFDAAPVAPVPEVLSLSPDSGPVAGGTSVTIAGDGFTGATAVTFDSLAATHVVVVDDSHITATTPAGAVGRVGVAVTTPGGTSAPFTGAFFRYFNPLTITSVTSSATGSYSTPSSTITLHGTGFTAATVVRLNSSTQNFTLTGDNFTVVNDATLTFPIPAGITAAVTLSVSVVTPDGTAGGPTSSGLGPVVTVGAPPTITSITPNTSFITSHGTVVTVHGTFLSGATQLTLGNVVTPFTQISANAITFVAPDHAVGTVDVRVTTPVARTPVVFADKFGWINYPRPTVSSVTGSVIAADYTVTISGANFYNTPSVLVGGVLDANVTSHTINSISLVLPTHAPGKVDVQVVTEGGTSPKTTSDQVTYLPPPPPAPTVSTLAQKGVTVNYFGAPISGNTAVTITGAGFKGATAVMFGPYPAANFTVVNDRTITAIAPAVPKPIVTEVTVTNAGGTSRPGSGGLPDPVIGKAGDPDRFEFHAAPAITSATPLTTYNGGSIYAVGAFEDITDVKVGTQNVSYFSDATVNGITAADPSARIIVSVASAPTQLFLPTTTFTIDTRWGSVAVPLKYVLPPPVFKQISPVKGVGGTAVKFAALYLGTSPTVTFDNVPATSVTLNSDGTYAAIAPAHDNGVVTVRAYTAAGVLAAATYQFTYTGPAPTITSLSPNSGSAAGGTIVQIHGTNLNNATAVTVDKVAVPFTALLGTITIVMPAHADADVNVVVTNATGKSNASVFDYIAPLPLITGQSKYGGTYRGGEQLVLTGKNFTSTISVAIGGTPASFTVNSDTQLTITTPAHKAGLAPVIVTNAYGRNRKDFPISFIYVTSY